MRLLLDTSLLLWAADNDRRLSRTARRIIDGSPDPAVFSVVSIWEVAIKRARYPRDFRHEPTVVRQELLDAGLEELPVLGLHALAVTTLPLLHGDPFDRMLVAQARAESLTLLTADRTLAAYGESVQLV